MDTSRPVYSTTEIVVRILDELAAHTDMEHGLTVSELARRVGATNKMVLGHLWMLQTLRPMGRYVGCLSRDDASQAESGDARPGWHMEHAIDAAQLRLLWGILTLSRIDEESTADSYRTLRNLAGYAGEHVGPPLDMNIPNRHNREFLSNVENLNAAIGKRRVVAFNMCSYDMTGELVMRFDAKTGKAREYRADPYQMTYKNGKYYLVCHMHGWEHLSYLHVDRIRRLHLEPETESFEQELNDFSPYPARRSICRSIWPSGRIRGPAEDIRFQLKSTLDIVFDWFEHPHIKRLDEHTYDVTVHTNATSTLWWSLQYVDTGNIEILEPQSLRDELARVGRNLVGAYGREIGAVIEANADTAE